MTNLQQMKERIEHFKSKGFEPKVILDIGAHKGAWASMIKQVFPKSELYLFEADGSHKQLLTNKGFDFEIVLLGDQEDQDVDFFRTKSSIYTTGNSIFRENTNHYSDGNVQVVSLPMRTLDSILSEKKIKKVDFIKLDVQGAELLILQGAKKTLRKTEAVLLEASLLEWNKGAPKIADVIHFMDKKKFDLVDIVELHYLNEKDLFQADLLFLKRGSPLIPSGILS